MKFIIHHKDDEIIIEGVTIEEIQEKVKIEVEKRKWNINDCWTEKLLS